MHARLEEAARLKPCCSRRNEMVDFFDDLAAARAEQEWRALCPIQRALACGPCRVRKGITVAATRLVAGEPFCESCFGFGLTKPPSHPRKRTPPTRLAQ